MKELSEFGILLNELFKKSGKGRKDIANEVGYTSTHMSNALRGEIVSERFVTRIISYFSELGLMDESLEQDLKKTALLSQPVVSIKKTKDKGSDLRLNRFKHNVEESMVLLKVQTMIARKNVEMATVLISKLENISSELLSKIISML